MKFVQLFKVLDKMQHYNDDKVKEKIEIEGGNSLSNLKAHLYEQLLLSLRLLYNKNQEIKVRDYIGFAEVLYQKGLFFQSLEQLNRAKQLADSLNNNVLMLDIVEFEKLIESRHVTHSHSSRAQELINTSRKLRKSIHADGLWSDLALQLYDYYLKFGHTKNKEEFQEVEKFFQLNLPPLDAELSFNGKVYREQSYAWYFYITQQFVLCYKYSRQWVNYFRNNPGSMKQTPDLYMKGMHNVLSALYYCNDRQRFEKMFEELKEFIKEKQAAFDPNSKVLAFIYQETAQLNLYFLKGDFSLGEQDLPRIEEGLKQFDGLIDEQRIMIFWYKMACTHFGCGNYKGAIVYLNRIINSTDLSIREDVQCFARILNLISHYELGNDSLIDYQIRNTYRYLLKYRDLQKVQLAILSFLRRTVFMERRNMKEHFVNLREEMLEILKDKYEARPLLYLDIISWLDSKIEDRRVEEVIQEKVSTRD